MQSYKYRINERNEIIQVDDAWDAFARYNQGAHLQREQILGKDLLASIPSQKVVERYQELLDALRTYGGEVCIPFRCDAPNERRFMRLVLQAEQGGEILLSGQLLKSEYRAPVALLDASLPRGSDCVQICSICLRMACGNERWCEIEEGVDDVLDRRQSSLPTVTYDLCPDCDREFLNQIQRLDKSAAHD